MTNSPSTSPTTTTPAAALVVNFSLAGPPGRMAVNSYTSGPVTAQAYYLNSAGNYVNANTYLTVRNETGDHGFGVCNPTQLSSSACNPPASYTGGGGDINELDNAVKRELIRLTIADGWDWTKLWLSSVDGDERGRLLYSNVSVLTGVGVDALPAAAPDFVAGGPVEFSITPNAAGAGATYLYFIPGPTGTNNDYLVWKAEVHATPEPATLRLVGTAISGAAAVRRWRRKDRGRS